MESTPKKLRWIWEFYLAVVFIFTLRRAFEFFSPGTPIDLYFRILVNFDSVFYIKYALNVGQIIFGLLGLLPLILFIYNITLLKPLFWKILFFIHIFFDVFGHPYALHQIISLYHIEPHFSLYALFIVGAIYLPAYWAHYIYAFKK